MDRPERVYVHTLGDVVAFALRDRPGFEAWFAKLPADQRRYLVSLVEQARDAGAAIVYLIPGASDARAN